MKDYKYKAIFASKVRCLIDDEKDKFLSQASLDNLKSIIPNEFRGRPGLLPIAFNACVPNYVNLNGHVIDSQTAFRIHKDFIGNGINLEHERQKGAFGHIISAGFSKFNIDYSNNLSSEIIEASEIKGKSEPFNLSLAGVLYTLYKPDLIELVEESNNPNSEHFLEISASWEIGYKEMNLAIGSRYLSECEIIEDKKKIEEYSKYLLSNGGNGKLPNGKLASILIKGDCYPLGIALTTRPAGHVRGIFVDSGEHKQMKIMKNYKCPECEEMYEMEETEMNKTNDDDMIHCAKCDKKSAAKLWKNGKMHNKMHNEEENAANLRLKAFSDSVETCIKSIDALTELVNNKNNISQSNISVVNNNSKIKKDLHSNMKKITSAKEITDEALEKKEITASQIDEFIKESLTSESEKWSKERKSKDEAINAATENYNKLQEQIKTLTANSEEIKKQLDEVKKQKEAQDALAAFNQRMAYFDDTYELDAELNKIIAADLQSVDDEGFKKVQAKYTVLLKNQTKAAIAAAKEAQKTAEAEKAKTQESTASTKAVVDDALKNAEKKETVIANTTTTSETLAERAKRAFDLKNWTIDTSKRRKS